MTEEKILCVDDDPVILFSFQADLGRRFLVVTAQGGEEALGILKSQGPFGVILADMLMPDMNGVELLAQAQKVAPDTTRIMLTGDEEKQTAVEAINEGRIFRFLSKPCPPSKLIAALNAGLDYYRLIRSERELLEQTLNGSVKMLTELLSIGEPEAFGRGQKICDYVRSVAPALELDQTWDLEVAALLAPIGFMTIPPRLAQKLHTGLPLTLPEKEMLDRVPDVGFQILSKIPRLGSAAQLVLDLGKRSASAITSADPAKTPRLRKSAQLLRILSDLVDIESKGNTKKKAIDQLRASPQAYDSPVFEAAIAALLSHESAGHREGLKLAQLEPGYELDSPVETQDGRLLAPAGTVLSAMMLVRFNNFAEISGVREPIFVKKP